MNKRTFNKLCRIHFGKRKKDELPLTDEQKQSVLLIVVRHRGPVHKSLITNLLDMDWIHCMGYLYENENFLLTSGNKLGIIS